jgi:uncharacterized alkaline shock family protein YloU
MSTLLREPTGNVVVSAGALAKIVVRAAESVDGVRVRRARRRLAVALDAGRARVELELAVRFGVVLPDAALSVQREVADALSTMCGVEVEAVDVAVEEVGG